MRRSSREIPSWLLPALGGAAAVAVLLAAGWFLARFFNAQGAFAGDGASTPAPVTAQPSAPAPLVEEPVPDEPVAVGSAPAAAATRMVVASLETRAASVTAAGELRDLVRARYGEVSEELLAVVRSANPGITDSLSAGDSVQLPLQVLVDGRALRLSGIADAPAPSAAPSAVRRAESTTYLMPPGSSLWEVISQTYGRYDQALLQAVLDQNPEITDVRQIEEGTRIRLPDPAAVRPGGLVDE